MDHLVNTKYDVKEDIATHVVTGIQYGADAIFVFDRRRSEHSSKSEAGGSFSGKIKLAHMTADTKLETDVTMKDREKSDEYTCTYYGDFKIDCNPSTIEEAKAVVQVRRHRCCTQLSNVFI
jgi:hypothetical protein